MSQYINRIQVLYTIGFQNNKIWNEVYDLPVADVAPVRHAYWIDHHSGGSFCSSCKRWVPYNHHPKYCETCGALMDGKEDEHEAG